MSRPGDARTDRRERTRGFVWPPRAPTPGNAVRLAPPAHSSSEPRADARLDLWRAFENAWLAPVAEPLPDRIERVAWRPDAPSDYCDRCGATLGPYEQSEFGCAHCRDRRLPWSRFVRLGPHRGPLRDWIHELKFTRWRRLGVDLGAILGLRILDAGLPADRVCIVPVPMPWRRRLVRGVDHAEALAEGVARATGAPMVRALARRWKPAQRGLGASTRARNVAGVFYRTPGVDLTGWTVVLVDDVRTTGATLRAASRALRRLRGRGGRRLTSAGAPTELWAAVAGCADAAPERRRPERLEGSR